MQRTCTHTHPDQCSEIKKFPKGGVGWFARMYTPGLSVHLDGSSHRRPCLATDIYSDAQQPGYGIYDNNGQLKVSRQGGPLARRSTQRLSSLTSNRAQSASCSVPCSPFAMNDHSATSPPRFSPLPWWSQPVVNARSRGFCTDVDPAESGQRRKEGQLYIA